MAEKIQKLGTNLEKRSDVAPKFGQPEAKDDREIQKVTTHVSEGLNVAEDAAEEGGVFGENEKKKRDDGMPVSTGGTQGSATIKVKQMPPVDVMITETVSAIEKELMKTEDEIKTLLKNKNTPPNELNDKVMRVRSLNGLLMKLKEAAKLAEEFVVGLWKQYVRKSG